MKTPPRDDEFLIFAADISLRRPGFALLKWSKGKVELLTKNNVDNKHPVITRGMALDRTYDALNVWMQVISVNRFWHRPDGEIPVILVREQAIPAKRSLNEIGVFEAVGVTTMWAWQKQRNEWIDIHPLMIKEMVAGNGKAEKDEVAKAVNEYFPEATFETDDESDACAVGLAYLIAVGLLPAKKWPAEFTPKKKKSDTVTNKGTCAKSAGGKKASASKRASAKARRRGIIMKRSCEQWEKSLITKLETKAG